MNKKDQTQTFVLVHGAWAGAWAVSRLARRLRDKGHLVHAPTLSGLAERATLAGPPVTLTTHVTDVVNEIVSNDLKDVTLVGCSYGGLVITGAAERVPGRIAALVYVDAFIPEDNQSFCDITGMVLKSDMIPAPSFAAAAPAKTTPQPAGTFRERLRVSGAYQRVAKKTYVHATGWDGPFAAMTEKVKADPSWTVIDIDCGHDIANERPDDLARILAE